MRVLVVGLGSIGSRHLGNLRLIQPSVEISVLHLTASGEPSCTPQGYRELFDVEAALEQQFDAALIASPAISHISIARRLAERGVSLLVEKPISASIDGVDELIALCERKKIPLMVGYHLRFDPSLSRMKEEISRGTIGKLLTARAQVGQYLPDWRRNRDYRETVSARSELGGGVVLELSHEFDYLRWIFGEPEALCAHVTRASDLEIDVEDTASIIVTFAKNVACSLHMNMVERRPHRELEVVGSDGNLRWDGINGALELYEPASKSWIMIEAGYGDRNQLYRAELDHFFECVRMHRTPGVSGYDGRRALDMALAVKRAGESRTWITL